LYLHEISLALREFLRVLKPNGRALIRVPDLEDIKPTGEIVYKSTSGELIAGVDMYFGHRRSVAVNPYMAHRFGFVQDTLKRVLTAAGFAKVDVARVPNLNELWAVAVKANLNLPERGPADTETSLESHEASKETEEWQGKKTSGLESTSTLQPAKPELQLKLPGLLPAQ
jgi:hypothetical protein